MWETWVRSLGWQDALEKGTATHSSILAGEFHGLYSSWAHKELDMTELLSQATSKIILLFNPVVMYGCESQTIKQAER